PSPPRCSLFPYTTLFRSGDLAEEALLAVELEDEVLAEAQVVEDELLPGGLVGLRGRGVPDRDRDRLGQTVLPGDVRREGEEGRGVPAPGEEHVAGRRGDGVEEQRLEHLAGGAVRAVPRRGDGAVRGQGGVGLLPGEPGEGGLRRRGTHAGSRLSSG